MKHKQTYPLLFLQVAGYKSVHEQTHSYFCWDIIQVLSHRNLSCIKDISFQGMMWLHIIMEKDRLSFWVQQDFGISHLKPIMGNWLRYIKSIEDSFYFILIYHVFELWFALQARPLHSPWRDQWCRKLANRNFGARGIPKLLRLNCWELGMGFKRVRRVILEKSMVKGYIAALPDIVILYGLLMSSLFLLFFHPNKHLSLGACYNIFKCACC